MQQKKTIKEEYFLWLYKLVDGRKRSYRKLCRVLFDKRFRWSVHNDDNRGQDGLDLRDLFIEENALDESHLEVSYFLKGEWNMFEVMVALAQRINDVTYDLKTQENKTPKWFMEMIQNLRLERFSDNYSRFDGSSYPIDKGFDIVTYQEICDILENLLDRTYDFYGNGSLFPLKRKPPQDMSKVEIWYQLMLYLDENYG